jgi:hypothetical protein
MLGVEQQVKDKENKNILFLLVPAYFSVLDCG